MNKFQKSGLAVITASGMAFAAGSLWGPNPDDFPSLQVKVPDALACWAANGTIDESNPCYTTTGGWWFGYTDQTASVKVKLNSGSVEFATGVSLSDPSDGSSLISSNGIEVVFEAAAAASASAPAIAGIGFNYKKPEGPQNITAHEGYCITYASDGKVQFELGWDEPTYNYDTWYAELPAGSKTVDLKWAGGTQSAKQANDFKKDGWGKDEQVQPIATATDGAWSVKIRLKNGSTTSGATVNFALNELGWAGECNSTPPTITPITRVGAELVKFNMVGRTFSLSSIEKPVAVQVINLQGAIVYSQTLASNEIMNLSNLPTGIYMLRIPSLSYANKIVLK